MSDQVGSLAEEATRLVEALAGSLSGAAEGLAQGRAQEWAQGLSHGVANGSPECRLCPFCQLVGVFRNARPEVFEHLLEASESMLAALRAAVAAHEQAWAAKRRAPVERIDIQ